MARRQRHSRFTLVRGRARITPSSSISGASVLFKCPRSHLKIGASISRNPIFGVSRVGIGDKIGSGAATGSAGAGEGKMLMQRALLVSSVSLAASFSSIPERTLRSPATYTRGNMWSWAADESQVVERKSCPPKEPLIECISKSLLPLRIDCIVECALFDVGCVTTCVAHIVHIVDCILECEIKPEASPPPLPALPPQSPAPPATPPSPAMSPNAPAAPYTCLGYNEDGEPFEPYCDKKHQSLAKATRPPTLP